MNPKNEKKIFSEIVNNYKPSGNITTSVNMCSQHVLKIFNPDRPVTYYGCKLIRGYKCWALLLEDFDYSIEQRTGKQLKHADALSRNPVIVIRRVHNNGDFGVKKVRHFSKTFFL